MKALILAAGFGNRLEKSLSTYQGPHQEQLDRLIKGKPKGLVEINGRSVVGYQLEQLQNAGINLEDTYVYTNMVFYQQYLFWAKQQGIPETNVFNNGVKRNQDKKEQVLDLLDAIDCIGYSDPLIVFASDTLIYDEENKLCSLDDLKSGYFHDNFSRVFVYQKDQKAFNHGVVTVNDQEEVDSFVEKPVGIESGLVNASVYLFSPLKLEEMKKKHDELLTYKNPLQLIWPGFKIMKVFKRLDIGTIDDVLKANNIGVENEN
jgi:NDP-sugar pyrophosphorylase family protein